MSAPRGLVWPLLLIAVGLVFLAANFGLIAPVRMLAVLSLWPLILVLVGIDLALARRWPLAALGADLLVIALGIALVVAEPSLPTWFSAGTASGQSSVTVPGGGAKAVTLRLTGGAGTYRIAGGASGLLDATSDQSDLRVQTSTRSSGNVDIRLDQSQDHAPFGSTGTHVDVRIASGVPASLDLNMGAGDFVLDLADVAVTDARVNVGAASLRLVLPRPSGDVPITVSAGASSVVIEIPDGVQARVTTSGALTSVRSENPRVAGTETAGYAAATDRVTIRVTAGASSVTIR